MEKQVLGGGCRISGGGFSAPLEGSATRPCARAAEVCDSLRAQAQGRFVRGGLFGCANRAFSRHDRGCAFRRTEPLRCCDRSRRRNTRRLREGLRIIFRAAVLRSGGRQVLARVHSSRAIAAWQRARAPRNCYRAVTRLHSERLRSAAVSTRCDAPPSRCAAPHANRRRRGTPGRQQSRAAAEMLIREKQAARLSRGQRTLEPQVSRRLPVLWRTFAGHGRKQIPHLLLNSSVTSPSGLFAIIAS